MFWTNSSDHEYFFSYTEIIGTLIDEWSTRFSDFENIRGDIELLSNLLSEYVENQQPSFQLELCELHIDPFLLSKKSYLCRLWRILEIDEPWSFSNFTWYLCFEAVLNVWKHLHLWSGVLPPSWNMWSQKLVAGSTMILSFLVSDLAPTWQHKLALPYQKKTMVIPLWRNHGFLGMVIPWLKHGKVTIIKCFQEAMVGKTMWLVKV